MADPPEEGFLPPEPAGPEPEIGKGPVPPQPQQPPPPQGQPPGQWGQQQGWQPPAGQQPPPGPPPPATWQGQWQQPPPGWQPPPQPQAWQQPQWAYPQEPDNSPAVTGFVLAMIAAGFWLISAGLSTLISLGLAIAGLIVSRNGKRKVASGETRKNKGLAQAGFISSIVMIVLASLSTLAWGAFFTLLIVDEDFRNDFDDSGDGDGFDSDSIRAALVVLRVGANLLS